MIWTVLLATSLLLALKVSLWFLILLLPVSILYVLYWIRVKNHFSHGDVNPGIVIQTQPTLVAVATDLTKRAGEYPAIKVFRTRMRHFMGEQAQVGSRLPTVSLYSANDDSNTCHWSDFHPLPVECGTSNQAVLQRMMESFNETEWLRLEAAIERLPSHELGLYTLKTWPPINKPAPPEMPMDNFWRIIELSKAATQPEQLEMLKNELQQLSLPELISFQRRFLTMKSALYDWDLWLVAWLLAGGLCSDDTFADFRNWVISQGRQRYETALTNPDDLVDVLTNKGVRTFESFSYVIADVYRERTHRDLLDLDVSHRNEPSRGDWLRPQLKDRSHSGMLNLCVVFKEMGDEEFTAIEQRFPRVWNYCTRNGIIKVKDPNTPSEDTNSPLPTPEEIARSQVDFNLKNTNYAAYLTALSNAVRKEYDRRRTNKPDSEGNGIVG